MLPKIYFVSFFIFTTLVLPFSVVKAETCEDAKENRCEFEIAPELKKNNGAWSKNISGVRKNDEVTLNVDFRNKGQANLDNLEWEINTPDELDLISGSTEGTIASLNACSTLGGETVDCEKSVELVFEVNEENISDGECVELNIKGEATVEGTSYKIDEETNSGQVCFSEGEDEDEEDDIPDDIPDDEIFYEDGVAYYTTDEGIILEVPSTGSNQNMYLIISSITIFSGLFLAIRGFNTLVNSKKAVVKNILEE